MLRALYPYQGHDLGLGHGLGLGPRLLVFACPLFMGLDDQLQCRSPHLSSISDQGLDVGLHHDQRHGLFLGHGLCLCLASF